MPLALVIIYTLLPALDFLVMLRKGTIETETSFARAGASLATDWSLLRSRLHVSPRSWSPSGT
jgi:hypothetical protein